jgi:PTS system cellobiose-specific IIA component
MELEQSIMMIIIHSGDARAYAYEALHKVNEGDYEGAEKAMEDADNAIGEAHDIQTSFYKKKLQEKRQKSQYYSFMLKIT